MKAGLIAGALAALVAVASPAWSLDPKAAGQPADELAAQKMLPKVRDALWTQLAKCGVDYDEKKGTYGIRLTPEVRALAGKTLTVRGFVLPMDGSDQTKHFLITRNTPVCLYCPPGGPNEVVEVHARHALAWSDKIVSVTGTFSLIDDREKALFFRMENAEAK
ncbi:DUF3299 domain-containing protein [Reyranella sp.]|uniref:DUF3299 domain-containing protein n=1 Tax=Reyranella sp. TaxID=1929291 RepID=UPI003BABCD52